jgi:hypothetical protein
VRVTQEDMMRDLDLLNKVMIPTQLGFLERINELRETGCALMKRIKSLENENLQLKRALEELSRQPPWSDMD